MRGVLELASGWWMMVGTYQTAGAQPCVTLVMQFDPAGELPEHGIKALRLSESEAEHLRMMLGEALVSTGYRGHD